MFCTEGDADLIKTFISFENSFRQQGMFKDMNDCYYDRSQLEYKLQTGRENLESDFRFCLWIWCETSQGLAAITFCNFPFYTDFLDYES